MDGRDELNELRHSASHILAQAVLRLFPDTLLAIGPAIENGFYYDFDCKTNFTPEILEQLEKEMKKISGENLKIEKFVLPREEAVKQVGNNPYKTELINELPADAEISFYRQGEFTDLCAGPHVNYTKKVKYFKLLQATGAYWRGSEKNKMLQRIYGTAFPSAEQLSDHLETLREARKRDHNKLGRQLGYFTTSEVIGQGLPIILPKGAIVLRTLQRFIEDEEEKRGYQLTKTPLMAKRELYKISGHWDKYRDGMFLMGDVSDPDDPEKEIMALRPMTCPFQFQSYLTALRSYRELPIRYNETATLFRNEASGEMHGLIRIRQFTLSEGHIVCTPEQLEDEFKGALELAKYVMGVLGIGGDISYRFSKWDENAKEKYIGDPAQWESIQDKMRVILDNSGVTYDEADGEAAFYGPKLDLQFKNVHGKEDTLITIQIDFQLAQRFGMDYVDKDGSRKFPYIIHRSSIGCYERTLALLIEKYAGAMPLWLAPEQARLLVITEDQNEYADRIYKELKEAGIRVTIDARNEKLGYKIREAQLEKLPYMLIVGEKEAENGTVGVRSRKNGDAGVLETGALIDLLLTEIKNKTN